MVWSTTQCIHSYILDNSCMLDPEILMGKFLHLLNLPITERQLHYNIGEGLVVCTDDSMLIFYIGLEFFESLDNCKKFYFMGAVMMFCISKFLGTIYYLLQALSFILYKCTPRSEYTCISFKDEIQIKIRQLQYRCTGKICF